MANEIRVRGNLTSGTLNGALTNVATSMSAAGLANLPVVGATQHAVIVIENEIVYVTAHTGGATTATILRGQEGTTAAAHNNGVAWVHGPVVSDFDSVLGYVQVVANQTPITTQVDLTSLTVTVTVPYAQHRVRISGYANFSNGTANNGAFLFIMEGATQLTQASAMETLAGNAFTICAQAVVVPTAASHTYKLQAAQLNGGTVTMLAGATFPAFILVEDLGPAL
jgi:hypothetical protein